MEFIKANGVKAHNTPKAPIYDKGISAPLNNDWIALKNKFKPNKCSVKKVINPIRYLNASLINAATIEKTKNNKTLIIIFITLIFNISRYINIPYAIVKIGITIKINPIIVDPKKVNKCLKRYETGLVKVTAIVPSWISV